MYSGFMAIDGVEVINNHRVAQYARYAGLFWVHPCTQCSSISAARGEDFVTPMKDEVKPPWWTDGTNSDELNFLGLMGLDFDNIDDSARDVKITPAAADGAYLGALRYKERSVTVRAIAVATDDCSLGFGLEWLRSVDTINDCDSSTVQMYDCCPHLAASDCDDPACAAECVDRRARELRNARITSGPTILTRRSMNTRGSFAQVEFVLTAGDPYIYSPPASVGMALRPSVEVFDPPAETTQRVVSDGFSLNAPVPVAPPSLAREPRFLPRDHWLRDVVVYPQPQFGREVAPSFTLWAQSFIPDVRVTLIGPEGVAGVWRMTGFPDDGALTMDFGLRRVTTMSNGVMRTNPGFVEDGKGGPMRWPKRLPTGPYELWVDRSPGTALSVLDADVAGRVA